MTLLIFILTNFIITFTSFFFFSLWLNFVYLISEEPDENSKEGKRPKYLDEEKFSYIQNYLGKSETHSVTTETSDGGLRRSHVTLSELGIEEISGKMKVFSIILST